MQIHIGNLIRDELRRQGRTNQWLADQLDIDRRTLQRFYNKSSIDSQLLLRISKILDTDFFKSYSDLL
ncbi:MAG: XRE family transcriptional regulator [Bacteroidales bacterium]|nr:XRE family transcriptional regulator [Bacteroidales bacterium]